jgi:nitrogen fixation protein
MSSFLKYKYRLFSASPDLGSSPAGLDARVTNLENNEYKVTYYEIISGTSGTITPPATSTFNSGEFGLSGNAILSKIDGSNKPTFETPLTSSEDTVTVSLNTTTGAYIASGIYTDPSVALIYSITIKAVNWSNLNTFYIIDSNDGNEIVTDYVEFNTNAVVTNTVGRMNWNNTNGTVDTGLKGGSVTLKNGIDLVARVVNKVTPNTTLTKAAYQVVKVTGAQGQRLAVGLAQANNDNNSADTLGIVIETIASNQEGFIMTVGQLEDINTTGSLQGETWADGDVLYLSPTTPGAITKIKPNGSTGHIVVVGYVEYAHSNHGKIYVKIMNGWELDELHNVYINNPTGGSSLEYQSSTSLWVNAGIQYTVELISALTVDFYAPYNMIITSVSNVLNSPTITIQDDNVAYTLGNTIAIGSKITVTASVASVINLNITK